MKKLVVIGSDFGSIDVVISAQKEDWYVIVADYLKIDDSRAKQLADEAWEISTTDIDKLYDKCKAERIDAVFSGAHDFNIGNVRALCKKLNLPIYCSDDYTWQVANNKRLFKDICVEVNAPVARDYTIQDISSIQYPVVVKPVNLCANRGMSYCDNQSQLMQAIRIAQELSKNDSVIIERKLEGEEFAVNYVIANGEAYFMYFSSEHSEPGYSKNLYSLITTTKFHLKEYLQGVNDKVIEVFKRAGCKEGIAWVECILDKDGRFYLLEMGHRFGGEMTYVPFYKVSGFDAVKWMFETAQGISHGNADLRLLESENYVKNRGIAASYHIFTKRKGIISVLSGLDDIAEMQNVFLDWIRFSGASVENGSAIGIIRIYASDAEDLCNMIRIINNYLVVKDDDGNDMIIYFTDYQTILDEYLQGIKEWE